MKVYMLAAIFLLLFFSCGKNRNIKNLHNDDITIIQTPDNWTCKTQDSIFSHVDFLMLETTPGCLISRALDVKFKDSLIFINDDRKRLLVFNDKGKFCYQIGRSGEGPGDYLEVRDFFIRNDSIIEILDFKKIEIYTLEGKSLSTKRFDFLGDDIYCNAKNFISTSLDRYYFWGGGSGDLSARKREKNPLLLAVDKEIKIIDTYFANGHVGGGCPIRFSCYDGNIIINPYFGQYNIYQFDENGDLSIRYRFDFGERNMPEPLTLKGLSEEERSIKVASLENYVMNLSTFIEEKKWLYQCFSYRGAVYNILYSKEKKRAYVTTVKDSIMDNTLA